MGTLVIKSLRKITRGLFQEEIIYKKLFNLLTTNVPIM